MAGKAQQHLDNALRMGIFARGYSAGAQKIRGKTGRPVLKYERMVFDAGKAAAIAGKPLFRGYRDFVEDEQLQDQLQQLAEQAADSEPTVADFDDAVGDADVPADDVQAMDDADIDPGDLDPADDDGGDLDEADSDPADYDPDADDSYPGSSYRGSDPSSWCEIPF